MFAALIVGAVWKLGVVADPDGGPANTVFGFWLLNENVCVPAELMVDGDAAIIPAGIAQVILPTPLPALQLPQLNALPFQ